MLKETICGILMLLAIVGFAFSMFWMINRFMTDEKDKKYILSKKKKIEYLQSELVKKDAELNIYRLLLKNVVSIDAIKKIVESSDEKTINDAKEMTEKGFFGD